MNMKRWLAGCLGAVVILGCLPPAGAADDAAQRRQEDLDCLVETSGFLRQYDRTGGRGQKGGDRSRAGYRVRSRFCDRACRTGGAGA